MSVENTLSIIKPDAVKRDLTGKIVAMFEEKKLRIVAQKKIWLSKVQAGSFYAVHKDRPFFDELCDFMSSGPIVVQVLQGTNAIERNRECKRRDKFLFFWLGNFRLLELTRETCLQYPLSTSLKKLPQNFCIQKVFVR